MSIPVGSVLHGAGGAATPLGPGKRPQAPGGRGSSRTAPTPCRRRRDGAVRGPEKTTQPELLEPTQHFGGVAGWQVHVTVGNRREETVPFPGAGKRTKCLHIYSQPGGQDVALQTTASGERNGRIPTGVGSRVLRPGDFLS